MFHRIKEHYNNLKLQTKLTITHLLLATIPMLVVLIFFTFSLYDMIVSDTVRKEQDASSISVPYIEEALNTVAETHDTILMQDFWNLFFGRNPSSALSRNPNAELADTFYQEISDLIDSELITDVKIYIDLPENSSLFRSGAQAELFSPIKDAMGTYWHGIFQGSPGTLSLLCPSFYLSPDELTLRGDMAYITRHSFVWQGETRRYYIAIYLSQDHFDGLLRNSSDNNVSYIINSRDSIVATTDPALSGAYHFSYAEIQEYLMSSNSFISKEILGEEVYAGFHKIDRTDWFLVYAIPSAPLMANSVTIMAGFFIVFVLCILLALLVAYHLSRTITVRLSTVIDQMSQARHGLPKPLPDSKAQDEIGDLISTYNYMTHFIHDLADKQARAAESLRIAEFHSLQDQINPHFLYNTMDMINWLAQQGRSQEVTVAVQNLSRFYKLTLSRRQSLSTIEQEIEHATIYVKLQNMRFNDNIDFIVDVPDTLLEYSLPNLTLQPFVENSILHGIMEKEDKTGTIVLTGWSENDTIVLLISDDGVGIPEDKLSLMLTDKKGSRDGSGSHIAVYNTHKRLQLLYGPQYGLSYQSRPGEGTEVQIKIPAILSEEA